MKDGVNWILGVVLVALIAYGVNDLRKMRARHRAAYQQQQIEETEDGAAVDEEHPRARAVAPSGSLSGAGDAPPASPTPSASGVPIASGVDESQARQKFSQAMHDLGPCLGLKSGGEAEPTLDSVMNSMKAELGEAVLQTEDWSSTEITTSSGERRRIRVEMDYSGEDRIVRRVKYAKVNADGSTEPIFLAPEQAEDPSDTFLAGLESDGNVAVREKAQRVYFGNGEEIVVTEKNGRISDFNMSRNGRTFQCQPGDPDPNSCRCNTATQVAPAADGP